MKEVSRKLLEKAERSLQTAERLLKDDDAEFAVGRVYYAMFYTTAEALLNEKGLRFKKHSGVHGAFGEHFAETRELDPKYHRWLLATFNERLTSDYGIESVMSVDTVAIALDRAREFLHAAQRYLATS